MPFFRVRTAFSGPPVIPHCKDIRFRVIAGYPDYGSSYHFYRIAHQRPQTVDFPPPVSGGRSLSCRPFPVRLVRLLPSLPSVSAFAVCFCSCCLFLFLLLLFGPVSVSVFVPTIRFRFCRPLPLLPSGFAFAIRSRPRRLFPLVPSASPALCRATKKPAAITGPQAFRSRRFSPSGSAIRLRARIRRCRKFCSDWD